MEPFAALICALGIGLAHILKQMTQPAGLASLNSCTGTTLYTVQQGAVRFNLLKTRQLPAFSNLAIYYLSMLYALYCMYTVL